MQIYEEKSAEFVDFAREIGGFESKEPKKRRKNRQQWLFII